MNNDSINQNILLDIKGKKIIQWKEKKEKSLLLSDSYYRLGLKKFDRVLNCSNFLEFYRYSDNSFVLNQANFCKDRLCPMCAWRRSLKIFSQTSTILNYIDLNYNYRYLFLTLTMKNCFSEDLKETLDLMFYGFKKLFQRKDIKKMCKGTFRALEITYNKDDGTFHPHFHIIIAVNSSYFSEKNLYISHSKFVELWKLSMNLNYDPVVNIKSFRKNWKGVAEASKYSVKDTDFLILDNEELTDKLVDVFNTNLKGRRLASYTGIFKKIHKLLNLDDSVDGDLLNINDTLRPDLDFIIEVYKWNVGIGNYSLIKE